MEPPHESLDAAIAALVANVRAAIESGARLSPRRFVVFVSEGPCVPDGHCWWWTITIDDGGYGDPYLDLLWGANRIARLLGAPAGARVEPRGDRDAAVFVERRGASEMEVHRVSDGLVTRECDVPFELLPGGPEGVRWGWDQHDDLHSGRVSGRDTSSRCGSETSTRPRDKRSPRSHADRAPIGVDTRVSLG